MSGVKKKGGKEMRLQEREEWELLSAMPSRKMFLTGWCFKDLNEMREVIVR